MSISVREMIGGLKRSLKPAIVRLSGLIGFALATAAFLESLQNSLGAGS